jgi:hypothetical protein
MMTVASVDNPVLLERHRCTSNQMSAFVHDACRQPGTRRPNANESGRMQIPPVIDRQSSQTASHQRPQGLIKKHSTPDDLQR